MKALLALPLLALLPVRAPVTDVVVTTSKHTDASQMMGQAVPASDTTEVKWIGTDRIRVEEGTEVTIVRADLNKMYRIDMAAKTYSTIDLPFDMKKYIPAEYAPKMDQMFGQSKVTVTPTTETKKVKDWNATHFTMTMSLPMGGSMTQEIWATKDLGIDMAAYGKLHESLLAANPRGGASMATEMKKVDGLPVLTERTITMMGSATKAREEVTTIERKEAPAGHYDVPAGFTEKPFDPMADMEKGMHGKNPREGRGPRGG